MGGCGHAKRTGQSKALRRTVARADDGQDEPGGYVHRLRAERGPVREALRQGRPGVEDAGVREAGPAGELASLAGAGGAAVMALARYHAVRAATVKVWS